MSTLEPKYLIHGYLDPLGLLSKRVQVPKISGILAPKAMRTVVLGTRNLQSWVLGPSGFVITWTPTVCKVIHQHF